MPVPVRARSGDADEATARLEAEPPCIGICALGANAPRLHVDSIGAKLKSPSSFSPTTMRPCTW